MPYYKVAGHTFRIESETGQFKADLSNYAPFVCEQGASVVFELNLKTSLSKPSVSPWYKSKPDPAEPRLDIYKCDNGYWVEMAPLGNMPPVAGLLTSSDFSHAELCLSDQRYERFAIDNSCMLLYALTTAPYDTLEFHSSVVTHAGRAYMFVAPSGTGKSTHSRMWLENIDGVELLNDDNPIVRIQDNVATCYGSPWSGKTPCYRNASAPVGAIARIDRAPVNVAERLGVPQAYASLMSSCSGIKAIGSIADGMHRTISALAIGVPNFIMHCRPDAEAALVSSKDLANG